MSNKGNLLRGLAALLRARDQRYHYGEGVEIDPETLLTRRIGINVTEDVYQAFRRQQSELHGSYASGANDGVGNSEWVLRMLAIERILTRDFPRYAFGPAWRELQGKAWEFFSQPYVEKVRRAVNLDAVNIVRFMETAALIVDDFPIDAIERIADDMRSETVLEGVEDDLTAITAWIRAYREAEALLKEKQDE